MAFLKSLGFSTLPSTSSTSHATSTNTSSSTSSADWNVGNQKRLSIPRLSISEATSNTNYQIEKIKLKYIVALSDPAFVKQITYRENLRQAYRSTRRHQEQKASGGIPPVDALNAEAKRHPIVRWNSTVSPRTPRQKPSRQSSVASNSSMTPSARKKRVDFGQSGSDGDQKPDGEMKSHCSTHESSTDEEADEVVDVLPELNPMSAGTGARIDALKALLGGDSMLKTPVQRSPSRYLEKVQIYEAPPDQAPVRLLLPPPKK